MAHRGSLANLQAPFSLLATMVHATWVSLDDLLVMFPYLTPLTAEEVQNASINVPRAMFFTIFINGALGFAMYIVILFCFGNVTDTLETPTGWPFIQIFYNSTQSKGGATAMTSILIAMYIFATFGFLASASRQAWAFARDNGLPFSDIFKRVRPFLPHSRIPGTFLI